MICFELCIKISTIYVDRSAVQKERGRAKKFLYTIYKENGGDKSWNAFQKALASGDITFETQPISVFVK